MDYDYKEILHKKASKLALKFYEYNDKLSDEQIDSIKILLNNTLKITKGGLDALDPAVRDNAIMSYHNKLDEAINTLSKFEPAKNKDNVIE